MMQSCSRDVRGFILAAGLGTRLRPITDILPKALVPLGEGKVLADHGVSLLHSAGIRDIGINASHLRGKVAAFGERNGLHVFVESPVLGTGGYLQQLETFLDRPMVVINCDVIFRAASDLVSGLVASHVGRDRIMTLVLRPAGTDWHGTRVAVSGDRVTAFGEGAFHFTGLYAVSPAIRALVEGPDIVPVMRRLAAAGELGAVVYEGEWTDCGTREGLIRAHRLLFSRCGGVYPNVRVSSDATVRESVLYPGTVVHAGAEVIRSVVMNCEIGEGERVVEEIRA